MVSGVSVRRTRPCNVRRLREYVEARGGKDELTEDEKKALVELAKNPENK